jgi:hypothetical protein
MGRVLVWSWSLLSTVDCSPSREPRNVTVITVECAFDFPLRCALILALMVSWCCALGLRLQKAGTLS